MSKILVGTVTCELYVSGYSEVKISFQNPFRSSNFMSCYVAITDV
jgi:hypothetical protein